MLTTATAAATYVQLLTVPQHAAQAVVPFNHVMLDLRTVTTPRRTAARQIFKIIFSTVATAAAYVQLLTQPQRAIQALAISNHAIMDLRTVTTSRRTAVRQIFKMILTTATAAATHVPFQTQNQRASRETVLFNHAMLDLRTVTTPWRTAVK